MSTAFGSTPDTFGKSGESIGGNGFSHDEDRTGRTEGNADSNNSFFSGLESFDPNTLTEPIGPADNGNATGGEPRRTKTGRIDRRTRAGRNAPETSDSVTPIDRGRKPIQLISLEKAIIGLHDMAAGIFGIEELQLSRDEAREYSEAVKDVSQFYVASFDPKKVAIANLITCMGGIYSTRIMAYRNRMEMERQQRPANVAVMPQPQQTQQPRPQAAPAPTVSPFGMNPPIQGAGEY